MTHRLKTYSIVILFTSVVIQVLLVLNFNSSQVSDQAVYLKLAENITVNNTFYPSNLNIYDDYIFAPGYINYLSLILKVFGNIRAILYFNIFLLLTINFELFFLSKKYFSEKTAWLTLLLSSIYLTHYGIILYTSTELLFTSLALGCICLYTLDKLPYVVLSGILLALANWSRPFLPVFIVVIILMSLFLTQRKIFKFGVFFAALITTLFIIGFVSYKSSGFFVIQSSTSGVNLIMGANDFADGSYESTIFKRGNPGYISKNDSLLFNIRDKYLRETALNWIEDNPIKYLGLIPKKLYFMYIHDFHSLAPLSGDMGYKAGSKEEIVNTIKNFPRLKLVQWLMFVNQIFYILVLLIGSYSYLLLIKNKNKMAILLGLIWILGTCMTIITVGGSRYHFPYIPILIIFTSHFVIGAFDRYKLKLF